MEIKPQYRKNVRLRTIEQHLKIIPVTCCDRTRSPYFATSFAVANLVLLANTSNLKKLRSMNINEVIRIRS